MSSQDPTLASNGPWSVVEGIHSFNLHHGECAMCQVLLRCWGRCSEQTQIKTVLFLQSRQMTDQSVKTYLGLLSSL
jgi:radical SAM protein with 4Fe4S-binding SPASM domain